MRKRFSSISAHGTTATCHKWQSHYASALSDCEIAWLAHEAHITTIRLPIGYFTLGPSFTNGTPFSGSVSEVYNDAWPAVLRLCERLYDAGIGVLLDLHALPGGANDQDHGGTSSKKAELWGNSHHLKLAKRCLCFMAEEVAKGNIQGCMGIELCNEACWDPEGMYEWYEDVVKAIGRVDASIPLYISDGWDLGRAVAWCAGLNKRGSGNLVAVDTHRYYCFTEEDKMQSPQQIVERVRGELGEVGAACGSVVDKGAVDIVMGEWSCALSGESWGKANGADRDESIRAFGRAQGEQWRSRAAGAFFWTAKMDWMDGGEWGLFEMVKRGAVVPPADLTLSFDEVTKRARQAKELKDEKKREATQAHIGYWDSTATGGKFEHWRFEQGWDLGFADAMAFYEMRAKVNDLGVRTGADTFGALELWITKRLRESRQSGGLIWEWEHGFRQGVSAFEGLVRTRQ